MGHMVCGAETTREDEVIYRHENQRDIRNALKRLGLAGDRKAEYVLEDLIWSVVRREESGE